MPYKDPEKKKAWMRNWARENRRDNPDRVRAYHSEWRQANPEKVRVHEKKRNLRLERIISERLRSRLRHAIKGHCKKGSAVRDLGLPIAEFKRYIEGRFNPGMTWENWGAVWHLDHIKPLAGFDLTKRVHVLEACNYKNLQPLLIADNLSKGSQGDRTVKEIKE